MTKGTAMTFLRTLALSCAAIVALGGLRAEGTQSALREVSAFDVDWRFARFGLQPDGSRREEPAGLEAFAADDAAWRRLDVPHDWGIEGPFRQDLEGFTGKLPWRGIGWYRKHFSVPEGDRGRRLYLDFDGAMAHAEVWLNGQKVGARPYGYISFRVDLTPHVRYGAENVVAVRLDTEKLGSRWYPGAGIYRHVRLVKTAPVHVGQWGVFVTTPEVSDASATVSVAIEVRNTTAEAAACEAMVSLHELGAGNVPGAAVASSKAEALTVAPNAVGTTRATLTVAHPKRWSLEATHRYLARVTLTRGGVPCDVYEAPFGIRTIQFTHDNGFLLNGKRVQIKGVCNHHDLGALGAAINTSALRRQLTILKEMGCNAVRTSHNPPAPELLELADEMGFLIMDEAFDTWEHSKRKGDYASLFKEWHERDLGDLIRRDRNHPSVILWSTGNEVHEQYNPKCGMAQRLTDIVHRFDPTRPATFGASAPKQSAMNGTELQVDVHGMNYAAGVYGGPDFYGKFLNKPGHETLSGYSSESASTLSSRGEYFPKRPFQVDSYDLRQPGWGGLPDQEFAALERHPGICGEFVWTGFDYLGEPTPYNSDATVLLNHATLSPEERAKEEAKLEKMARKRPTSRSSYFGIVDLAGFPKDRYYLYQAHWRPDLPMAHILPHWNFPDRVGKKTPVFVYTSGDEAELFLNGKSLGRKKKGAYEYRLKWDDVVYAPGELKAVAYRKGAPWAEARVATTGPAVRLKLSVDKTRLRADGDDLAFIRIAAVDAQGNEVPTAEPVITGAVSGPGRVVATDNGDPTCHIAFANPTRPAFNGLCLAIVQAHRGQRGSLRFTAQAPGLAPAEVTLAVGD